MVTERFLVIVPLSKSRYAISSSKSVSTVLTVGMEVISVFSNCFSPILPFCNRRSYIRFSDGLSSYGFLFSNVFVQYAKNRFDSNSIAFWNSWNSVSSILPSFTCLFAQAFSLSTMKKYVFASSGFFPSWFGSLSLPNALLIGIV